MASVSLKFHRGIGLNPYKTIKVGRRLSALNMRIKFLSAKKSNSKDDLRLISRAIHRRKHILHLYFD